MTSAICLVASVTVVGMALLRVDMVLVVDFCIGRAQLFFWSVIGVASIFKLMLRSW